MSEIVYSPSFLSVVHLVGFLDVDPSRSFERFLIGSFAYEFDVVDVSFFVTDPLQPLVGEEHS